MYFLRTLSLLQAVFATLRTTPLTPTINPTSTPKETSNSTLDVNMSQSSQPSITGSLEPAQFAKGTRSDTPFRFTESRTPVVKVTKKSPRNPPVSTRRDVQLSESQLQPSRSPGHHYCGERHTSTKGYNARHTHSQVVPTRTSRTVEMNIRTSQPSKPITQLPRLRSLPSKPSPPPLALPWWSRAPACAPTPPHGCAPWQRHRLGYLIPRHGTRYLTVPWRSWAWSPATITSTSSTSGLHATASASAWLPDSPPRHPLPHTSSAVTRSGMRSHSTSWLRAMVSASAWLPDSLPRYLLPHNSSAVAGFVHLLLLPPQPPSPPPSHSCAPWYRHRLGNPVSRYSTRYLTFPWRLRALFTYYYHLHLLHLKAARHGIGIGFSTRFSAMVQPHTSSAVARSGVCSYSTLRLHAMVSASA